MDYKSNNIFIKFYIRYWTNLSKLKVRCQLRKAVNKLDWGLIRWSLRYGLSISYKVVVSLKKIDWWKNDGATSKINDILIEHGELPHVLSLPVHLKFSLFEFICVTPPSCLDGWWVVANRILVSATVPLGLIGSLNLLSSPGPKPLAPNPLVPNPKPRGLGLTLKCSRPPPTHHHPP